MKLRTLYLQRMLSINGRNSLAGRQLYDHFRNISEDCLLGHMVVSNKEASACSDPRMQKDIISYDVIKRFDPNLIYIEEGLFVNDEGKWKISQPIAEELVSNGAVIIVADADVNELCKHKDHYKEVVKFFRAVADYGSKDDVEPVYGADQTSFWKGGRQIVCQPEKMVISEWLRPIYDGISEILVGLPVRLAAWQHLVASANNDTSGTLQGDIWVNRIDCCPFASAANYGQGYVVLIAGLVSGDVWLERCPDNVRWLSNLGQFLLEEASSDHIRAASHLRSPYTLFLSHKSIDKKKVEQVASEIKKRGLAIWFDKEKLIPSDSLVGEIDRGLEHMTHFVLFWSHSCLGAPWVERELKVATAKLIEHKLPILIVRLDSTPVPTILSDLYRIEAESMSSVEIARSLAESVEHLAKRKA